MSRQFPAFGRFFAFLTLVVMLCVSGFGQASLRKALDFDGDNKADFSIFRLQTGAWWIYGTTGNFILGQEWGIANEDRLTPGDYDGDGRGDLAVFRDSTGVWHILRSSNYTYLGAGWGVSGDEPVARDYDGDGRTDIAIARRGGGIITWWVSKSTGGTIGAEWGANTDFVVPGDFDGDGKFDFAVQRPGPTPTSIANFYVYGSTSGFLQAQWGISTDFAVPGDYDGDGKTDFAIIREGATATDPLLWAIYPSGGSAPIVGYFGLTGDDFTAQADYDGDGKTDIAIWRQSTGTYWIVNSSNGSVTGAVWGMVGDQPVATYDTH